MRINELETGNQARLKRMSDKERDAEQRERLRAAALAVEGVETLEIQQMLGRSRGFVRRWAYAYRDGGIGAIATTPHPGKPARLPASLHDELRARLDAGAEAWQALTPELLRSVCACPYLTHETKV